MSVSANSPRLKTHNSKQTINALKRINSYSINSFFKISNKMLDLNLPDYYYIQTFRGCSSMARASAFQAECWGFESPYPLYDSLGQQMTEAVFL